MKYIVEKRETFNKNALQFLKEIDSRPCHTFFSVSLHQVQLIVSMVAYVLYKFSVPIYCKKVTKMTTCIFLIFSTHIPNHHHFCLNCFFRVGQYKKQNFYGIALVRRQQRRRTWLVLWWWWRWRKSLSNSYLAFFSFYI